MIIFLLILGVLLFSIFTIGMNRSVAKYSLVGLSLVVILGSLLMLTVNDVAYWGMKEVSTTSEKPLSAATNIQGTNTVLYKALGNGKEKVYIYKTSAKQKKVSTTKADIDTTNKLVRSNKVAHPTLETKTYKYIYKNNFYKLLFAGINGNNRVKKYVNTFNIPESWVALSTDQVAKLQKQAKSTEKTAKAQITQAVETGVAQAKAQNPNLTATEQKALVKEIQTQAKKQMAQQVAQKLQSLSLK
ncbi:DUF4811 domain-containing protein [Agrilactobacillus yilanensis]|uniref:DUF4811 domain-containing protein n=1 Tax=Agrilactobacillus yilanensis TaxID=2485997 RepID=A0ABW4JB20_9LACO|nr:DUF4811 domain-containing protein [Agrilactobacillus yilanensis]